MFDKAGRDATEDFAAAHGAYNLRVESAMLPYRIGTLLTPRYDTPAEQQAYQYCLDFLHTVSEIRNVFCLDVNIFEGRNEPTHSPHSIAMRVKTLTKFADSALQMLEAAAVDCCEKVESLSSKFLGLCPSVPATVRVFRENLLSTFSASGPEATYFVATELCQIGKDFLTHFVQCAVEFVSNTEVYDTHTYGSPNGKCSFPGFEDICDSVHFRIDRLLQSITLSPASAATSEVIRAALSYHPSCAPLVKIDFTSCELAFVEYHRGDIIFRKGDIIDLIYVVVQGEASAWDEGNKIDVFTEAIVFGAIGKAPRIDLNEHVLGNELMKYTAKVASESCTVAVLHPLQLQHAKLSRAISRNTLAPFQAGLRLDDKNSPPRLAGPRDSESLREYFPKALHPTRNQPEPQHTFTSEPQTLKVFRMAVTNPQQELHSPQAPLQHEFQTTQVQQTPSQPLQAGPREFEIQKAPAQQTPRSGRSRDPPGWVVKEDPYQYNI